VKIDNFFAELKRRNVYKVAVAYVVIAWLLLQGASILFPTFEAPPWVIKVFVVAIAAGFVLPFESLSEVKANVYFAEGIQDEILTASRRSPI
jgi:hypothetical protein